MKRSLLCALVVLGATVLPAVADVGCSGTTGGKRFPFEARAGGIERPESGQPLSFTNETGWTVTLTKADVTIGPLYLNVIPPLGDETQSFLPSLRRPRFGDLFVKSAWAAGEGHLGEGRIVGEVLAQLRFSALSSELAPFPSLGSITQEEVRTAEVWLYPAPATSPGTADFEATKIATTAVDVAGEATKNGSSVRFRGSLVLDDTWQPDAPAGSRSTTSITEIRKVRGIPAAFFPEEGGHLELRFDVRRLFRGADFSSLAANPADDDGTKVLVQAKTGPVTTDQVMTNLYEGLRQTTGTYSVRWIGP